MIVKCNDYLPKTKGDYDTNMGKLTFKIYGNTHQWYRIKEEKDITHYECVYPIYWVEEEIKTK
jgi:hypothetical protein